MKKQWKYIKGYEDIYQINNLGEVKSIKRNIIMKPSIHRDGYYKIKLCKNGEKRWYQIHRLVAQTFLKNEDKLPCVNHKDENKLNNNVNNLEWCTIKYNNSYGTRLERVSMSNKTKRAVLKYDLDGNFMEKYSSLAEAFRKHDKIKSISSIALCCQNKYKQTHGFIFRYECGGDANA